MVSKMKKELDESFDIFAMTSLDNQSEKTI